MSTDLATLRQLAHLSRLELDETKEEQMLGDLNKILNWVDQLRQLDTTDVEPLVHLSHEINVLRPDEAHNSVSHQEGLRNAPRKDSDYFRVPKVLE
ncbi:Asp-tRNA(Asn)/Glu-tRNA(Gln) amidotransferase subunit GatC [Hymenobacter sp. APR13]|uniref:Asp-tRNA(Asn)/Glu-tRNA(Gln) amidotransferase subunit GatC n=1 Tax=Hymenobacter sp. APR13 TaxID=1356852 RepID=UPI0004E09E1B|nr:Asp-tRNA(Asn)/Glu-tRNA(Gln) amidotransferase subunit GatC [Hymenobacter sp. APR13]AII52929.1 glutamyl-tRNA amidotransferase subunit C [Hymenobacter sp. APR13]